MSELKSCPFCGGKARIKGAVYNDLGVYGNKETDKRWFGVYCSDCLVSQPKRKYSSKLEAITAWNRRAQPENKLNQDEAG